MRTNARPGRVLLWALLTTVGVGAAACAGSDEGSDRSPWVPGDDTWQGDQDVAPGEPPDGDPSFREIELSTPVLLGADLVVTNRLRGTLIRVGVDAAGVRISSTPLGFEPADVVTLDVAGSLVALSSDGLRVALVRWEAEDPVVVVRRLAAPARRVSTSPDGRAFVLWTPAATGQAGAPVSEVQWARVQGDELRIHQISVGAFLREVRFSDDGAEAYVLSDDGVSVLRAAELEGDTFVPPVPYLALTEEPEDFVLTQALLFPRERALVLPHREEPRLRVLRWATGAWEDMAFEEAPRALRGVDGGRWVHLLPGERRVQVWDISALDVPALDLAVEQSVETLVLGGSGEHVYLFDRRGEADANRHLIEVDLQAQTARVVLLRKGIQSVVVEPSGQHLIVVHRHAARALPPGASEAEILRATPGYSLVERETLRPKLVLTSLMPNAVAVDEAGTHALLRLEERGQHALQHVDLVTYVVRDLALRSRPRDIGFLARPGWAYASQEHPLGRFAFYDVVTRERREVTGFELQAWVE